MSFFIDFIQLILSPWVWVPSFIILMFLTWQNNRRVREVLSVESTLLVLEIPKTNDKSELAAEQLFASLHGILRDANELRKSGGVQEHLSFEIASVKGQIRFYVWTPKTLQSFVEGQIYAQYPSVQIHEASEDYVAHERDHSVIHTAEITVTDSQYLPIKTFQNFEVDPLAGITGTLAKLEDTNEELWVQVLIRPIPDSWHKESYSWIEKVKSGGGFDLFGGGGMKWLGTIFEALWKPPEQGESSTVELSERDKSRIAEAERKAAKLGFQIKIRLAYLGESKSSARLRMQAIVGTFKQFNSTNLNGFGATNPSFDKESVAAYRNRLFTDDGFILNIEELASVFHLPHTNVETPNIVWASTKTAEPPAKLPVITGQKANDENISAFGLTNFRGINHQFGMLRYDRSRHVYIIGQTGAGKSGLLELFALSDIFHNQGYAIIDPHGDFAINNMKFIPPHRVKDVVYFNPADTAYPVGFNPLEVTDPNMKSNISSEVIGVLKRMFGESWGPRLEYILRYTILALLDRPETTMLDIARMLTDKKFRKETLDYCTDTVVLQFWKQEFGQWGERQVNEAIAPVLNKVGAFTANPVIRNIIGQPKSTFNIRKIMDEGKILVVNLSKGLIGEDNAGILGSFLVTKIQLAAMSRSDIPDVKDRRPFYLYVDEFQNFATDSFATILSEARKYGLNLTVANQYISQMTDTVRGAVFGNVGTMISFRVSAEDAQILAQQFEPQFEAGDLLQMHNRHFIINMVIKGEKAPAFSATTLNLPPPGVDNSEAIINSSRQFYARGRAEVEQAIDELIKPPETLKRPPKQPTRPAAGNGNQQTIQSNNQPKQGSDQPNQSPMNQPAQGNAIYAQTDTKLKPIQKIQSTGQSGIKPSSQPQPIRRVESPSPTTKPDGVQVIQRNGEIVVNLRGGNSLAANRATSSASNTPNNSSTSQPNIADKSPQNKSSTRPNQTNNNQSEAAAPNQANQQPATNKKRRRRRRRKNPANSGGNTGSKD